jgi:hypothetical protein
MSRSRSSPSQFPPYNSYNVQYNQAYLPNVPLVSIETALAENDAKKAAMEADKYIELAKKANTIKQRYAKIIDDLKKAQEAHAKHAKTRRHYLKKLVEM